MLYHITSDDLFVISDPVGKKPSLERKSSGNKTQQTLIATATKLAMVGFAGGLYQQQGCPKVYGHLASCQLE